jgi:hypothetical protein
VARCNLRHGERGGPGRLDGSARRDRRGGERRATRAGPRARAGQRRGLGLAGLHRAGSSSAAWRACAWSSATPTRGWWRRRGDAAGRRLAALIGADCCGTEGPRLAPERRAPWQRRSASDPPADPRLRSGGEPIPARGRRAPSTGDERPGWALPGSVTRRRSWRRPSWRSSSGSIGEQHHQVHVLDGAGATRLSFRVPHDRAGLERPPVMLETLGEPCEVGVAIERRERLLVEHLLAWGHPGLPGQPQGRGSRSGGLSRRATEVRRPRRICAC